VALPGGHRVGLVTDSVKEVLSVPRSQAEPVPGMLSRDEQLQEFSSICRLDGGKRLVSIIATDKLLGVQGHPAGAAGRAQEGGDATDPRRRSHEPRSHQSRCRDRRRRRRW
jgi:purine-binding chemotaxis protein CheW